MTRLRHVLSLWDLLRLRWWLRRKSDRPIRVKLRTGMSAVIRPAPTLDYMIFYEVFVNRAYEPVWPEVPKVNRIVDVGGYVGYSCLFWQSRFPGSLVTVYEPMPEHVTSLGAHIADNRLKNVHVRPVAAAPRAGKMFLTAASASSRVAAEPGHGRIAIEVVDFFNDVGPEAIDLLKLDCEGGERELLADPRFADLRIKMLVMECHDNESRASPETATALAQRLQSLGYATAQDAAMIWARK